MVVKSASYIRKFSSNVNTIPFFTTPIYYVNASPHIGHLYSSLIADAAQRWSNIYRRPAKIKFSTGTDEHGSKIQQAAHKNNTSPAIYCDKISSQFQKLAQEFSIGCSDFIRTTSEEHKKTVNLFWNNLNSKDRFYKSKYEGWYCVPDETFLTESQLTEKITNDGKKVLISTESGHPVEWSSEENYMFKLSEYQNDLQHWLKENETAIQPKKFYKIVLDFLHQEGGLQDLSVSRPSSRVSWGIPVPGDDSQTIYVWLDALTNYLTAAGYGRDGEMFKRSWPPDVQVIGKDILKFHAIYWPAFLLAADLEPPQNIFCHSHWTVNNEKMSKSKGNVVCPFDMAKVYSTDGVRYFLLHEGVAHSDGNYSDVKVLRMLNAELADTLGNLLSRCTGNALNYHQKFPQINDAVFDEIKQMDVAQKLIEYVENLPDIARNHYDDLNFYKAIDAILTTLHSANLFFETLKPWDLKKHPETQDKLNVVLHITIETLRVCGILLQPVIPNISKALLDKINVPDGERTYLDARKVSWCDKDFKERELSGDKLVLFRRIQSDSYQKVKKKRG